MFSFFRSSLASIYLYFIHGILSLQLLLLTFYFASLFFLCVVDNYVVAWKRGIAILSAGSVKVTPDPRVHLVNGYSLQIKNAVPQDAGDYVCQIATLEPREITHTVEILGKFMYITLKYNFIVFTVDHTPSGCIQMMLDLVIE